MNQRFTFNIVTILFPILMILFSELSFEVSEKFIPMIFVVFTLSIFFRHIIKCPNCNHKTGKGLIKIGNFSFIWWKVFAPKKCSNCGYVYNEKNKTEFCKSESFKLPKFEIFNIGLGIFISCLSIAGILISFLGSKFSNTFIIIYALWIKFFLILFIIGMMFFVMGYALRHSKNTLFCIFLTIILILNSIALAFWFLLYILDSRNTFLEINNGLKMLKILIHPEYMFIIVTIIMSVFIVIPFIYNTIIVFSQITRRGKRI